MQIIKNREIVDDGFIHLSDDAALPASGDVTVTLSRWVSDRDALKTHCGKVGVRLAPDDDPSELQSDLPHLALIAIEFPKFTDGRGYSAARILRDRLDYSGELRAIGNVLRDQLFYLSRVGINAFELSPGKSLEDALRGFEEFSVTYQAAVDDERPIYRRGVR
jgi:uncharacterized protein (DUF934 family)